MCYVVLFMIEVSICECFRPNCSGIITYLPLNNKTVRHVHNLKVFESEYFLIFLTVRLLSVLRGHSLFHPRHNGQ